MTEMMVVTEQGDLVDARHWIVRQLCPHMQDEAFLRYAVRNLGVVVIRNTGSALRVYWRSEGMMPATVAGTVQWLSDQDEQRIALSQLSTTWSHTVLQTVEDAIRSVLRTFTLQEQKPRRFFIRRRSPEVASRSRLFSDVRNFICSNNGVLDLDKIARLSKRALADRYIILSALPDNRLIVRRMGQGFLNFDPHLPTRSLNLKIEDQPDLAYGQWIASAYREASVKIEPIIDEIDAEMEVTPNETRRLQYRRLILPAVDTAGNRLLLGTSEIDNSIALAPLT